MKDWKTVAAKNFSLSRHINKMCDQMLFDALNDTGDDWSDWRVDIWNVHNSLPVQMFMWQRNYMLEMGYIGIYVVLRSHGLI
jgi:hypothetical protein